MSGVAPFTERPTHLAKGRWIGDFGKLSPLERQLLAHVAAGKRLVIATSRPKGPSARNRIRADLIRFLVLGGDQTSPVHELGIEISGAWITGRLNLAEVSSSSCLVLLDCHFTQPVIALGARLAGLFLSGSFLPGLNAQGIDVKGGVFLNGGFTADGEVSLSGAQIGGQLSCEGGTFRNCDNDGNSKGDALIAQGIDVKGDVFLQGGFTADGEVSLAGGKIGGELSCSGSTFRNCDKDGNAIGMAINAQGIDVKGSVFLRDGFTAEAEVSLSGAQIGGQLSCEGSTFRNCDSDGNAQGMAINAQDIDVKGSVHLRGGFIAEGEVSFIGAQIGGQVSCNGGTFRNCDKDGNAKGIALNAQALVIKDGLIFKPKSCIGGVDLTSAAIADLVDNSATWPRGRYYLSGLRYERLHGADTIEQRIDWLRGQTPRLLAKDFAPQPWEQLIRVQREMGHPHAARKVAIAKQKAMRRAGIHGLPALKHRFPDKLLAWASVKPIGRAGWEWFTLAIRHPLRFLDELRHDLFGILTGYGHAPWRALSWTLAFWLIFAGLYWDIGIGCTALLGCDSHFGPALTYSADALLPVDLGLVKASLPISDTPFPQSTMPAFRALTIMENLTGWVLGILILAMIGNLIRKD